MFSIDKQLKKQSIATTGISAKWSCVSCAPSWRHRADFSYNLFMFSLGFILPVLIILWSSSSVYWRVYTTTPLIQLDEIRKKMIRKQWKVLLMVNI